MARAAPPPLIISCARNGPTLLVAAALPAAGSSAERQATLDALGRGLRAEIVFQLRVYAPSRGPAALLGDRLIVDVTVTRSARWDPFAERFVLRESAEGTESELASSARAQEILDGLFTLDRQLRLPAPSARQSDLYLTGRYRLRPVRLDGMLSLVVLVSDLGARTGDWSRVDLGAPR